MYSKRIPYRKKHPDGSLTILTPGSYPIPSSITSSLNLLSSQNAGSQKMVVFTLHYFFASKINKKGKVNSNSEDDGSLPTESIPTM